MGPEDDDFEDVVPRPTVAFGVYVPPGRPDASGFYADGFMVPDLFATEGDARSWIKRMAGMLPGARPMQVAATKVQATRLAE